MKVLCIENIHLANLPPIFVGNEYHVIDVLPKSFFIQQFTKIGVPPEAIKGMQARMKEGDYYALAECGPKAYYHCSLFALMSEDGEVVEEEIEEVLEEVI
jgi:hypothetical protein